MQQHRENRVSESETVANADGERHTRKEYVRQTERLEQSIPNWRNFPTQSPVCSRDDVFSPKLDGITFSKWRRESIKAYGNAVVPALVFKIFKAIEQIEQFNNKKNEQRN